MSESNIRLIRKFDNLIHGVYYYLLVFKNIKNTLR